MYLGCIGQDQQGTAVSRHKFEEVFFLLWHSKKVAGDESTMSRNLIFGISTVSYIATWARFYPVDQTNVGGLHWPTGTIFFFLNRLDPDGTCVLIAHVSIRPLKETPTIPPIRDFFERLINFLNQKSQAISNSSFVYHRIWTIIHARVTISKK